MEVITLYPPTLTTLEVPVHLMDTAFTAYVSRWPG
jgi:hypothetical protein